MNKKKKMQIYIFINTRVHLRINRIRLFIWQSIHRTYIFLFEILSSTINMYCVRRHKMLFPPARFYFYSKKKKGIIIPATIYRQSHSALQRFRFSGRVMWRIVHSIFIHYASASEFVEYFFFISPIGYYYNG